MTRHLKHACLLLLAWTALSLPTIRAESTNWLTIFDEQFADNPTPAQRFKIVPVFVAGAEGSTRYDEARHAYSLSGFLSLVRPVSAGAHVELEATLRFLPARTNDPSTLQTDLMLVLSDRSLVGVELLRSRQDEAPATVRFVSRKPGVPGQTLREVRMPGMSPDGVLRLRYRHGLLTLVQGRNTVGSAGVGVLGITVAGVSWIQKGGEVGCERLTLRGEPFHEIPAADQEALERASRMNVEAQKLLHDSKAEEALSRMEKASALFVKVHGEMHHDSANSFANRAHILESIGSEEEAGRLWSKALAIHEKTLGPTHPHTTLMRFNLGKNCLERKDKDKARELWTRCRDDWASVFGPEYPSVKSLDSVLPTL